MPEAKPTLFFKIDITRFQNVLAKYVSDKETKPNNALTIFMYL